RSLDDDLAEVAAAPLVERAQPARGRQEGHAARAEDAPRELQDAGVGGVEEEVNRLLLGDLARGGVPERAHPEERLVRRPLEEGLEIVEDRRPELVLCAEGVEAQRQIRDSHARMLPRRWSWSEALPEVEIDERPRLGLDEARERLRLRRRQRPDALALALADLGGEAVDEEREHRLDLVLVLGPYPPDLGEGRVEPRLGEQGRDLVTEQIQ